MYPFIRKSYIYQRIRENSETLKSFKTNGHKAYQNDECTA